MLKKIIIVALIAAAAVVFYNKFVKSTMDPFFNQNAGKVDLFQLKSPAGQIETD